ncbi:MAG: TMEM175 family protein [Acidimicrobiales bacterium]
MTDGVATIAITLLVLSQPAQPGHTPDQHLSTILAQLGAPFFAFALSFAIVAFAWYGHHRSSHSCAAWTASWWCGTSCSSSFS